MAVIGDPEEPRRRSDVERNERLILEAAAGVFAASGGRATVREVAAAAGLGMGTLYRHFPTRADLVIAVYRDQIQACVEAGEALLASSADPFEALLEWSHRFVDFLGTKHGLVGVMRGEPGGLATLHRLFVDRLVPILDRLLQAGRDSGQIRADDGGYQIIRAVGDLCAYQVDDPGYDMRRSVTLLISGLREPWTSMPLST